MWTSGAQGLGEAQLDIRVCAPWLLSKRADIHACAPSLLRRRVDIHLWCPRPDIGLRRTRAGGGRCASPSIGRLLKSHWAQIRILKRVSAGPWAPEVDIGTPPQELSGTHPILTRASPRPWAPEADIGSPPQKPLGVSHLFFLLSICARVPLSVLPLRNF